MYPSSSGFSAMKGCSVRPGETTARRVYDMPKKHLKKSAPDYPLEENTCKCSLFFLSL